MAKHTLSLEVLDTLNEAILRIVDTSIYDTIVPVDCPVLSITVPGFSYSTEFDSTIITPGFSKNFTACDLGLQTTDCGTKFSRLPDGIYIIKYSVSPNDIVYVEYNYLKVSGLMNIYQRILCELDVSACEPLTEVANKLELLRKIKMYIEAAKAKVEICLEPSKGMELYGYAKKLLSKFNCSSCQ
jgi:hypothetical protein